jgi:hypothetical protein
MYLSDSLQMNGEVYGGNITKTICKVFGGWGIPYKDISFLTFFGTGAMRSNSVSASQYDFLIE